jgi:3-deoxy-manno-octulosonate cytidylyltransferase (CMP-KDO synthetase)
MSATVIIPARYASSRFPGKPLVSLLGEPMIRHVYRRAEEARRVGQVWVATDDERIARAVEGFGGNVAMTSAEHASGTDRVAEAAARVGGDPVVNLQGDEPLIRPGQIDRLIEALEEDPEADMATLCVASEAPHEIWSPHCVKVVTDHRGYALYFSRAPVPFYRSAWLQRGPGETVPRPWGRAWIHIGAYGFRRRVLEAIPSLGPSPWDAAEQLEQLRFLHWGYRILVVETSHRTVGVDVPEDVGRVEDALRCWQSEAAVVSMDAPSSGQEAS